MSSYWMTVYRYSPMVEKRRKTRAMVVILFKMSTNAARYWGPSGYLNLMLVRMNTHLGILAIYGILKSAIRTADGCSSDP